MDVKKNIKKLKDLSILVVDDDMSSRIIVYRILTKTHDISNVVIAENGKQAIELCREQTFDIIFMDVRMPSLSGQETMSVIKGFELYSTFIAHTADINIISTYMVYGFDFVLIKPVDNRNLKAIIEKALITKFNSS